MIAARALATVKKSKLLGVLSLVNVNPSTSARRFRGGDRGRHDRSTNGPDGWGDHTTSPDRLLRSGWGFNTSRAHGLPPQPRTTGVHSGLSTSASHLRCRSTCTLTVVGPGPVPIVAGCHTTGPEGPPVVLVEHTCRYRTYTRRPFGNRPIHFVGAAGYTPCGLSVSRGGPRRMARHAINCPIATSTIPVTLAQAFLWSVINSSSTRAAPRRRPRPTPSHSSTELKPVTTIWLGSSSG
jgi:hypothetical protein